MKIWNTNICLTSPVSILIMVALFFSTIVLANVWPKEVIIIEDKSEEQMWVPTKEDIVLILERLDYEDGTWDSIRYVKGGKIDKHRNK